MTTTVANRLAEAGYPVSTTEVYVTEAQVTAADTSILAIVQILGLAVVAITLMGLVSGLSTGVIERTREVGILRCLGARARNVRRVVQRRGGGPGRRRLGVRSPARLADVPGLLALILRNVDVSLPQEFPPVIPLITFAGVLVLTLLVIRGPLRRATGSSPAPP